jgi:myo-inositol 2-dehydrogenase / D-chiro-inositol 1-dehydrogenase
MSDLGIGIIGLGRMGWLHAEHLHGTIRGARLIAAAVDENHRRQLQSSGEAPCDLVPDVAALINDHRIDAIVVVSPTSLHHEHIQRAAAAGKAIFAEKPLADSVERSRETAAAVAKAGVPFQIGFQRRFDPGYARAKELIDSGAIGAVEMFRGLTCDVIPPVSYLRTSGGLFWDLGIHDFDAARFLMNDDVVEVTATGSILIEPELADFDDVDHGIVVLRFRRGGIGVVQNAWRAPYGYDIRAEVHGTLGKVVTDLDERVPTRLYRPSGFSSERYFLFVERFADAYRLELQAFVDAVLAGREPAPGIDDALHGVLISDAATRSRRTGTPVAIDLALE